MDSKSGPITEGNKMANIIINLITFRECVAQTEADNVAFDLEKDRVFAAMAENAAEYGHALTVDKNGQGAASYRVTDEADYQDLQNANDFMQSDKARFWELF